MGFAVSKADKVVMPPSSDNGLIEKLFKNVASRFMASRKGKTRSRGIRVASGNADLYGESQGWGESKSEYTWST